MIHSHISNIISHLHFLQILPATIMQLSIELDSEKVQLYFYGSVDCGLKINHLHHYQSYHIFRLQERQK